MAITRRQFVTRLGTLAAAMGLSQMDIARVAQAFGHVGAASWTEKPKVLWVHGAECTGCSTSLLSFFEDVRAEAVPGSGVTTAAALSIIAGGDLGPSPTHPFGHRTLETAGLNVDGDPYAANIADVLIDFIDLQYHETVMAMGGDLAYTSLMNEIDDTESGAFVLVVEGSVQPVEKVGYWGASGAAPWCSIAADGSADAHHELSFDYVVEELASNSRCAAVIAMGQCATFGGYPACQGPGLAPSPRGKNQTGAMGVYDFLVYRQKAAVAEAKVFNVSGCPSNPWWFVLTAVLLLVKLSGGPDLTGRDSQKRMSAVYGNLLHSRYCPRYADYGMRRYATKPGQPGCLKNIGCKGISTRSLCGIHGWNSQHPGNALGTVAESAMLPMPTDAGKRIGTNCLTAGHPCMGCTEKGYPDSFVPYIIR
ncbi:MAG: hypothetical protein IBX62_04505 [Coriobacteriia bacterium]|nr:hypothetical protein [Coriobacteriia bacterium]